MFVVSSCQWLIALWYIEGHCWRSIDLLFFNLDVILLANSRKGEIKFSSKQPRFKQLYLHSETREKRGIFTRYQAKRGCGEVIWLWMVRYLQVKRSGKFIRGEQWNGVQPSCGGRDMVDFGHTLPPPPGHKYLIIPTSFLGGFIVQKLHTWTLRYSLPLPVFLSWGGERMGKGQDRLLVYNTQPKLLCSPNFQSSSKQRIDYYPDQSDISWQEQIDWAV